MKWTEADALAYELDAQCLRIMGDAQGAANFAHKAEQIRAGTYQPVELCQHCHRTAEVLFENAWLCRSHYERES